MNGKRFSEDKAKRNGFYLALAVCLVAVGIAAWSTYDAVHSYVGGESSTVSQVQSGRNIQKNAGNQTVSTPSRTEATLSQAPDLDPEKPAAKPSAPVRQTGGTVSKPSVSSQVPVSSQPESSQSEEPQIPTTAPLYERSSQMIYPLGSQEIAKAYSAGAPVYSETMKDWRIHAGMDVTAQASEDIRACANGQVMETRTDSMLGNIIVIEHGDYVFSYCGVGEEFQVKEGDIVTKGQVIGTVTAVPCEAADQPHLHLEVRRDGVCLDPQTVIEGKE